MTNDQTKTAETHAERYLRETLSANGRNPSDSLPERMGVRFHTVSPQRLVATMPVAGNTQPYGLLHGGASVVLAESLGSLGATLHAGANRVAIGLEVSATHHRPISSGEVTGTATAIRLGRSVATYEVAITDEADRRVCTSRITCLIRSRPTDQGVLSKVNDDARSGSEEMSQSTTQANQAGWRSAGDALALLLRGQTARVAAPAAILVGSVLSVVNQGAIIAAGQATAETWMRVAINYVVPFIVASVGALSARRLRA